VICFAGDGGTYDIGMATLSAAAERDEDLLYICYDNEIYGNTGGQRSSATPLGARTTTTPGGKDQEKKDILAIMAAHRIPYTASISLAHPEDALAKFTEAVGMPGFRFIHVLSPCPTGWKSEPSAGIKLVRLAVLSGLYPICTIRDGHDLSIDVEPDFDKDALREYFAAQRRFREGAVDVDKLAAAIERNWQRLRRQAGK
jgi:pyruvate ferredoxin oxidoreductase beta subunit/2-oxoisovalerate ferredoxin oxidoreductase beta subunit